MNYYIDTSKFYILSGPSASGKSSLTQQLLSQGLPSDAVISTDSIRKQILGSTFSLDENGVREELIGWELNQPEIFHIIENILSIRLKQKLPTILDATHLNDDARKPYVELAKKYGIESQIIIFNIPKEELKIRLAKRIERFDFSVVEKQLEKFSLTSQFPYLLVNPEDQFTLLPLLLNNTNVDVVGDVHGLLNETVLLLKQKGWGFDHEKLLFSHPDKTRQVFFLGDAIDRGTQSIEFIIAIQNTVATGQGLFILGNHEAKLMASYEQYKSEGIVRGKSLSSSQTFLQFLALPQEQQESIYQFLLSSPIHYSLWIDKSNGLLTQNNNNAFKIAFAHADNDYYDPYRLTRSHALYGRRKLNGSKDSDAMYEKHYLAGLNQYVYIRGHIPNISKQDHIYSLEEHQAFAGYLVSLDLNSYIKDLKQNNWVSTHKLFEDNIVKQKSDFNFDEEIKTTVQLMKKMDELVKNGLATDGWKKDEDGEKRPHADGFKVYKYSKKVHFKRLWQSEPLLSKARGLGLDIAGNIIVHPFDKLYNYGEYDTGHDIKPEHEVQMVEKLNGFLGCISKHPFKNELLLSTTGSFNSPFVQYIADFIDEKTKNQLLNYFKENKQTLMFEVIHPDDKHIIEYAPENFGLWLIGARGLNMSDKIVTETQLDNIAKKLDFKRPKWETCQFKDVLNLLPTSPLEGYMVRDANTHEPLMKIKTNYYLVTKFVGRMGNKMTTLMYKNPEKFKEHHIDEEFYPIVDEIVTSISQENFEKMEQKERVDFVRNIIDNQRNNVSDDNKKKLKL